MDLNKLIKDIKRGKNIEQSLPDYAGALAGSYYNQALYMLAMDLASDYDLIREDTGADSAYVQQLLDELTEIIDAAVIKDTHFADAFNESIKDDLKETAEDGANENTDEKATDAMKTLAKRTEAIRNAILKKLDTFGAYTYFMQIYEYILNRIENSAAGTENTDAKAFAGELLSVISADTDVESVNMKIQEVLGELPVRLTAGRFFDMIKQGCKCYAGTRNDIVDAFMESIERCARPVTLETLDASYADLYDLCKTLYEADLAAADEAKRNELTEQMEQAAFYLTEMIRSYVYLADLVNDVWLITMTRPYVVSFNKDMTKSVIVIHEFMKLENKGTFLTPDEDIVGLLRELTDRQDVYQGEHMMLEDALFSIVSERRDAIDELQLTEVFEYLKTCALITSTAIIGEVKSYEQFFAVDTAYIENAVAKLETHFKSVFETVDRMKKRSMMALTIGSLPVVFDSMEEVEDYIVYTLDSCRDVAEKAASMNLLRQMFMSPQPEVNE